MTVRQDIYSTDLINSTRKQLRLFYPLVGITALLLAWLTVGLGPSTWWLLLQVIKQFSQLWSQHGVIVLWSLILLVAQSLLLLAAWILLIWIAASGGSHFYAVLPEAAMRARSMSMPKSPPFVFSDAEAVVPYQPASPQPVLVAPQQSLSALETVQNPQVEQSAAASPLPFDAAQVKISEVIVHPPHTAYTSAAPMGNHLWLSDKPAVSPVPPRSQDEERSSDPFAVHQDEPGDPFAVHEDVLKTFMQEIPPMQADKRQEQTSLANEQDHSFVFGNPFDGPLPDVFEHDEDLKRSIAQRNIKPRPGHAP